MAEYIEREALYQKVAELEMLARDRYLDTPTNSPVYSRYMAQLGERTHLKFLIADFPAADVVEVVRCKDCVYGTLCTNCAGADYVDCALDDCSVRKPHDFCSYGERRADHADHHD